MMLLIHYLLIKCFGGHVKIVSGHFCKTVFYHAHIGNTAMMGTDIARKQKDNTVKTTNLYQLHHFALTACIINMELIFESSM